MNSIMTNIHTATLVDTGITVITGKLVDVVGIEFRADSFDAAFGFSQPKPCAK